MSASPPCKNCFLIKTGEISTNFSRPIYNNTKTGRLIQEYTKLMVECERTWSKVGWNILIFYLFFILLGIVKQLFSDAQIRISDFHGQIGCKVVHESIAQLRVSLTEHDQFFS